MKQVKGKEADKIFFSGVPLSEIKSKQSMQIKVLNQEEIEKMRVACRVSYEHVEKQVKT